MVMHLNGYSNFHDDNLDWLLDEMRSMVDRIENYVSVLGIKYADPFDWSITSQYEQNTLVIDPTSGTAYLSLKPVPAGINITNTDYWTPVFTLGELIEGIREGTAEAVEVTNYATQSYAAGRLIWVDKQLVRAKTAISAGSSFNTGTGGNCEVISVENIINELKSAIEETNTNLAETNTNVATNAANITSLEELVSDLETVSIINTFENVAAMLAADLPVNTAVHTMGFYSAGDGGEGCYIVNDNGTVNNMSVFRMDNGKYAVLQIPVNGALNIKQLGAKGDGTTDISNIVNTFSPNYPLYIPVGIFAVNNPLKVKNSIFGETSGRFSANGFKGSVLRSALNAGGTIDISGTVSGVTIKDIEIDCTSNADAIYFHPDTYNHAKIENVTVRNFTRNAVNISPTVSMSRAVYIDECSFIAEPWTGSTGIYLNNKTADCRISDTEIMGVQIGIDSHSSSLIVSNVHIWNSNNGTAPNKNDWWMETRGVRLYTTKLIGTNLYIDCPRFIFDLPDNKSIISVNNIFTWADATLDSGIDSTLYDGTFIRLTSASNEVYEFNGGIIYCDDHHSNMFNTQINRQIKLNNVKIISRTDGMCYLDPTNMYMLPSALQINNGEVLIPNYGNNYMAIAEYFSDWACCDKITITGPDSKCIELQLMANRIAKTVIGADIDVYYMRFTKNGRYITRIVIPSGSGYYVKQNIASFNANTRLFANFTYNNAPFAPVTYSDTTNLTRVS